MIKPTILLITCFTYFLVANELNNKTAEERSEMNSTSLEHPVYCVFLHSPGPNWKEGISFQEQPGVKEHVLYMNQQLQNGLLIMGGPFLDNSGGMMIFKGDDIKEAGIVAESDPSVISGLLNVEIKLWKVPMSSIKEGK